MKIKVDYVDGTSEIVPITLLDQAKAEEYATAEDWGTAQQSPIRFGAYMCYWHLRHTNAITDTFEQWLTKIETANPIDPKSTQPVGNETAPAISV